MKTGVTVSGVYSARLGVLPVYSCLCGILMTTGVTVSGVYSARLGVLPV